MSILLALLIGSVSSAAAPATSYDRISDDAHSSIDALLEDLWEGKASFKEIKRLQIQTNGPVAPIVPRPTLMDSGTQIFAMSNVDSTSKLWYLFNREYFYDAAQPSNCPNGFSLSRIVVRSSEDRGDTWSNEAVIAQPNVAAGECEVADGHAFFDSETNTWHYIAQVYFGLASSAAPPMSWHLNHYMLDGRNPMAHFAPDSANPVVKSGQLWDAICRNGNACPAGTREEGTPEISFKANGDYYVTFHGAYGLGPVWGYRGIAKTADFHRWWTHSDDAADPYMPAGSLWSPRDCANWNVSWSRTTGCIGGGHASSLITPAYTYMLIESADLSLSCRPEQNWVIGLVRAPNLSGSGKPQRFVASGRWQQYAKNPLISSHNHNPCSIQYPRFFVDGRRVYLTYWTIETKGSAPSGALDDRASFLRIAQLVSNPRAQILARIPKRGGASQFGVDHFRDNILHVSLGSPSQSMLGFGGVAFAVRYISRSE